MDEERLYRRLDDALDRLAQGAAPAPAEDPDEAALIELARAVRGLGEPAWPEDDAAFLARLHPPRPARRRLGLWPAAAAAALATVALTPALPTLPFVAQAPQAPRAASFAASAPPGTMSVQSVAPNPAAVGAAPATGASKTAHALAQAAARERGVWLRGDLLAIRLPSVVQGPYLPATDLEGRTVRLPATRRGGVALLDFAGLASGYYRLGGAGEGLAVLMPAPAGAPLRVHLELKAAGRRTAAGGVEVLALDLGPSGLTAQFLLPSPGLAPAIRLVGPSGAEEPAGTQIVPVQGGYRASLTFNPVASGTRQVRFELLGGVGAPVPLATVELP